MKLKTILTTALLTFALPAPAQISTDGTLGPSINLSGPNFQIGAELGQQHGPNLFHSFRDFNLNSHESATFSGPNSVQNLISRVTGGNPSNIDGLFRSTISGANVYFLNPYGLLFGPNARLDVLGSFHASTADYLRLGEGGRFDVRNPSDSILTVAPIESFGFLTDNPAPIHFQGSELGVPPEKELTVVGGNIMMEQEAKLFASGGGMNGGKIKMASVASQGEVILLESDLLVSSFNNLGDISILGNSDDPKVNKVLRVSGEQAGLVLIRGENMLLSNRAFISANSYGNTDETGPGEGINMKLSGRLKLVQASEIETKTFSSGQTAPIVIEVDRLELQDGSQISSNVWSSGQGNHLTIKANEILLSGVSEMAINSHDGAVSPNTSSIVSISHTSRADAIEATMNIEANHLVIEKQGQINVASLGAGKAGSIHLNVGQLVVNSGGGIVSTALGLGDGGSINIKANDIVVSNVGTINSSGIGPGKAQAGNISIEADNLELSQGGNISVFTLGLGKSGTINLKVSDHIQIEGQADESMFFLYDFLNGQLQGILPLVGVMPEDMVGPSKISASVINMGPESAGSIDIEAGRLSLHNGAKITGEHRGMGDAGHIGIRASDIRLTQGTITTETFGGGGGGNITVNASNLLYLREGDITTSVGTGKGDGGNITIENPQFTVLNQGQIIAQAYEGNGGNIRLGSEQLVKSPCSQISASSKLGVDGNVDIESPAVNLDDFLVALPGTQLPSEMLDPCRGITDLDQLSTFSVNIEGEGMPTTPSSLME